MFLYAVGNFDWSCVGWHGGLGGRVLMIINWFCLEITIIINMDHEIGLIVVLIVISDLNGHLDVVMTVSNRTIKCTMYSAWFMTFGFQYLFWSPKVRRKSEIFDEIKIVFIFITWNWEVYLTKLVWNLIFGFYSLN